MPPVVAPDDRIGVREARALLREDDAKTTSNNLDDDDDFDDGRQQTRKITSATTKKRKRRRPGGRFDDGVSVEDFSTMSSPHPYGVKPDGNRFLLEQEEAGGKSRRRLRQQGEDAAATNCLNNDDGTSLVAGNSAIILGDDECLYRVLEYCDGPDLARLLRTCRYLYAACSEPELWRDLVLFEHNNGGSSENENDNNSKSSSDNNNNSNNRTIASAGPTWKDAYARRFVARKRKNEGRQRSDDDDDDDAYRPHRPIPVPGVYSDFFYRLHSCRSFAIPKAWTNTDADTVARVRCEDATAELFLEEFERRNRPVAIGGAARRWKAFDRWSDPAYLLDRAAASNQTFRATSGAAPLPGQFRLEAYFEYCSSAQLEESPLYLFDRTALSPGSDLWKDYFEDLQASCPYWDPDRLDVQHDLFKVLGEGRRPDHTWFILGPQRSGSVFHIDPNATHAWNAAIAGRKRWIFYPPGVTPPGVLPSEDGDSVALPLSIGEWLFQFWDEHCERKRTAPPGERPLECTAMPGDVLFVPHGWWHMVVNLDDINIAITHNYVSETNLSSVFKFLSEKRDQVSGCRDREESIKPERLYDEFVGALRKENPDLVKRAIDNPDWDCRAWTRSAGNTKSRGSSNECERTKKTSKPSIMAQAGEAGGFSFSFM